MNFVGMFSRNPHETSRAHSGHRIVLKGLLHTLNETVIPMKVTIQVEVRGVMLGQNLATGKHFKCGLVRYHVEDDDGMVVIVDVAQGSMTTTFLG
ncbi:hypothetical protein Tco_0503776, partial [Tanacetum coccineum]